MKGWEKAAKTGRGNGARGRKRCGGMPAGFWGREWDRRHLDLRKMQGCKSVETEGRKKIANNKAKLTGFGRTPDVPCWALKMKSIAPAAIDLRVCGASYTAVFVRVLNSKWKWKDFDLCSETNLMFFPSRKWLEDCKEKRTKEKNQSKKMSRPWLNV